MTSSTISSNVVVRSFLFATLSALFQHTGTNLGAVVVMISLLQQFLILQLNCVCPLMVLSRKPELQKLYHAPEYG